MKQVWLLNHYSIEPGTAGITRHFDLAVNLRNHGWQATLIASSVEHITGRQRLSPHEYRRRESYSDVPFLWIRTPQYRGNGLRRILNMFAYTWRALMPAYTKDLPKPDLVIGSSAHPLAAMAGLLLARRHAVPFVYEVRDLWPQTLIEFGKLRENSPLTWILRRHERWLYQQASRIVVPLPYAGNYIASRGISVDKVVWIPNGVELSAYQAINSVETERVSPDGPDMPFVLMYFGAHGRANGLDPLLHAMKLVAEKVGPRTVILRMIGNGPLKADLKQLADSLELTNVSFEPPVPKNMIPKIAAQADAFVITVRGLPKLYRYGISMNKLFDYLAAGRPIIIASNAANNPVRDAGAGITVPPEDPESLARAILTIYRTPLQERRNMGQAGRRYVEVNHNWRRLAARLADTLNECVAEGHAHKQAAHLRTEQ